MKLSDYERLKFQLAEILRNVATLRSHPGRWDEPVQELLAGLAEDRFNIALVGRFSRGKSSLMNALLGSDRLPTGIVPLTSVITAVGYGSEESVTLTYEGRRMRDEVKLNDLARYVTQEGNPGNVERVRLAEVRLPAELLRRGVYFVDTPGLGSAILENTRTTESFVPAADAFILVTSFESPLSEEEMRLLRDIAPSARRTFIVVNKQDMVSEPDRARALAFVEAQLESLYGEIRPQVFSISALDALRAKLAGNDENLQRSGLPQLETALLQFLLADKSAEFLRRMCERIGVLLREQPAPETTRLAAELGEVLAALESENERVPSAGIGGLAPTRSEEAAPCEICGAMETACFDFLSTYQYELTVSIEQQKALAERRGLCNLHTWWFNNLASPRGICIGWPELLESWAEQLFYLSEVETPSNPDPAAAEISTRLPASESCPVCKACEAAERAAISATAARLDARKQEAVDSLSAICVQHLPPLLQAIRREDVRRGVLLREAGLFERVAEDMRRYGLKFDAVRRSLASRAEESAPERALRLVAGGPNLSFVKKRR